MHFGLTNASAIFQHLMNDIFCEFLDDFVVCYLDNILIFSKNEKDHENYVWLVLEKLHTVGFYAKLENCVSFTNFKSNSLVTSFLIRIQRKSKPSPKGKNQQPFRVLNVFSTLSTSIGYS